MKNEICEMRSPEVSGQFYERSFAWQKNFGKEVTFLRGQPFRFLRAGLNFRLPSCSGLAQFG